MRAFHWRWRWRLFAVASCLIAVAGTLCLQSLARDPAQVAFDQIRIGMVSDEVDAAIAMEGGRRSVPKENRRLARLAIYQFTHTNPTYHFAKLSIRFDEQDRVLDKKPYRFDPTSWDKLTHWVTRIRRAVGL
jgi:hypothetical protein